MVAEPVVLGAGMAVGTLGLKVVRGGGLFSGIRGGERKDLMIFSSD